MVTVDGPPTQSAADQVLTTTRAARKGLDTTREVPRELIEGCLRVAMQVPIGSNGLYPHFIVVTDPAKRTALAGFCPDGSGGDPGEPDCAAGRWRIGGGERPDQGADGAGVRQTFEGWQGISIGGSWGLPILPPVSGYATRTDYHELRR